jgi:transposase InsO family protein
MFWQKRFEKFATRMRVHDLPLHLSLWNGAAFALGQTPRVTVSIPNAKALRHFLSPTLDSLGHAYVQGEIDVSYGSPRMVRELRLRGYPASKERVERLMQENGIKAKHKRRFKVTTDSKHNLPVAPNLLDRNFTPSAPNQAWTSDISVPQQAA